ncbi:MAG: tRNA lysidine(34) synthetase TilS [Spirochaetales bacterium]|nr:tRNA lysidine(34) synthetase TilS [Spirochaetales bacterium]
MEFKEKVIKALFECGVNPGSRILVAFSGGPDSTALLHALKNLSSEHHYIIFAACLDHGLRKKGEIDKEIKLVQQLTAHLGVELFIGRIPSGELSEIAYKNNRSLEEAAREKRYQFLNAVRKKIKADHIAIGHSADDNIETMVMRFFQGGGVAGLAGIPISRKMIIRPLYYCSKEDILTYLQKNQLNFAVDSSNLNKVFLRNKIRLNLLPVVKHIFPGYLKSLTRLSSIVRLLCDYVDAQAAQTCSWEKVKKGYRIGREKFFGNHEIIRLFSLYKMLNDLYNDEHIGKKERIPYRFLSRVLNDKEILKRKILIQGYGIILLWEGNNLFCKPDIVYPVKKGYLISVKSGETIKAAGMGCIISIYNGRIREKSSSSFIFLSENCIVYPMVIRSRFPGDTIEIETGTKSIKKILNEWKVPEEKRWEIPILVDRKRVLAIIGKEFGYKNRCVPGIIDASDNDADIVTIKIKKED